MQNNVSYKPLAKYSDLFYLVIILYKNIFAAETTYVAL